MPVAARRRRPWHGSTCRCRQGSFGHGFRCDNLRHHKGWKSRPVPIGQGASASSIPRLGCGTLSGPVRSDIIATHSHLQTIQTCGCWGFHFRCRTRDVTGMGCRLASRPSGCNDDRVAARISGPTLGAPGSAQRPSWSVADYRSRRRCRRAIHLASRMPKGMIIHREPGSGTAVLPPKASKNMPVWGPFATRSTLR